MDPALTPCGHPELRTAKRYLRSTLNQLGDGMVAPGFTLLPADWLRTCQLPAGGSRVSCAPRINSTRTKSVLPISGAPSPLDNVLKGGQEGEHSRSASCMATGRQSGNKRRSCVPRWARHAGQSLRKSRSCKGPGWHEGMRAYQRARARLHCSYTMNPIAYWGACFTNASQTPEVCRWGGRCGAVMRRSTHLPTGAMWRPEFCPLNLQSLVLLGSARGL